MVRLMDFSIVIEGLGKVTPFLHFYFAWQKKFLVEVFQALYPKAT
jgi:hypothetical protein